MGLVVLRAGARKVGCLFVLTGCVTLGVLGLGAVKAHAAKPSSLAGETLIGSHSGSIRGFCTRNGGGSFNFSTSGTATGPYPGTFSESGTFTLQNDTLTAFSADFTITSANGSVTGSKSLLRGGLATCDEDTQFVLIQANLSTFTYTATIDRSYRDTGRAMNGQIAGITALNSLDTFSEEFTTSNGLTSPPPPPHHRQHHHHRGHHHHHHHHHHEE